MELEELFTNYNQARSTQAGELFHSFLTEITPPISRPTPQLEEFSSTLQLEEFTASPPPALETALETAYLEGGLRDPSSGGGGRRGLGRKR